MDIAPIDSAINSVLENYIRKPTVIRGVVHFLIILYAARIAPRLPQVVLDLFENQYFKLFVFSLILWTAQMAPSTSILIALAFMVTVNYSNKRPLWEFMENTSAEEPQVPVVEAPVVEMTPEQSVIALAQAAASPEAVPPAAVIPVAEVAQQAVTTEEGAKAVSDLAQQAMVPEAGVPEKVQEAAQVAMESMPPAPPAPVPEPAPAPMPAPVAPKEPVSEPAPLPAGCFPMREYDMSKVEARPMDEYQSVKF
jgi:hypothetical protein